MTDLKIPNLNKNSDKFFLKKKLSLRRKSKRKLKIELFLMFFSSIFMIYLVSIIPDKKIIFSNLLNNFVKLYSIISDSISYSFEIFLALFIIFSLIFSLILILGAFYRLMKILRRKSRHITYR